MKTILNYKGKNSHEYYIIFGNEKFIARYNLTYPRLCEWSLSRREKFLSNSIIEGYYPCGRKTKFKSLNHIRKWIRDRKYL